MTHNPANFITGHVNGYLKTTDDGMGEVLFSMYADGVTYRTEVIKRPNDSFNKPGRKWHKVEGFTQEEIRTLVRPEFCGRYTPPV